MDATTALSGAHVLVVMGVSGAGKSTLAQALAGALGWDLQEGDDLHPPANLAKMRAGIALDDADRAPWLACIADWIATQRRAGRDGVISCSALKRAYRQRLRAAGDGVRFVYLRVPAEELRRRVAQRAHFMPSTLLDSQLATLEEPRDETDVLTVTPQTPLTALLAALGLTASTRRQPD